MIIRWPALVWIVSVSSTFAFLSVFWWSVQRRREREAYYRYELARRLLERAGAAEGVVLEWVREVEAMEAQRRRHSVLLGALVTLGAGIGGLAPLRHFRSEDAIPGSICAGIGLALLVYYAVTRRSSK
jgi:hypothetical protein